MRRLSFAVWLSVFACGGSPTTGKAASKQTQEADVVEPSPTPTAAPARVNSGAGEKRITFREHEGFHGQVRRTVQNTSGYETVSEFTCAGYPIKIGSAEFKFTIDASGCAIASETMLGRSENVCDLAGRHITTKEFDASGQLKDEFRYAYDAQGRDTLRRKMNPDGSTIFELTWIYNERGDVTKEHYKRAGKPDVVTTYSYEYLPDGSKVAMRDANGARTRITYESHGLETKSEPVDAQDVVQAGAPAFIYKFDEQGNWTHKGYAQDEGEPHWVTTRTHEYCEAMQ